MCVGESRSFRKLVSLLVCDRIRCIICLFLVIELCVRLTAILDVLFVLILIFSGLCDLLICLVVCDFA